ncbi:hypothetical protein B0H17DRAFT_1230917 [Mycena rosella]|uniref:Uncharacterized protein n=1 Tax=Mycena rosella TaxID=1033263 RepID=A0AAD7AZE4_MYCRO|nr:hypothetical protein B0H17DRAFT_1230917 [Mycena rosella]
MRLHRAAGRYGRPRRAAEKSGAILPVPHALPAGPPGLVVFQLAPGGSPGRSAETERTSSGMGGMGGSMRPPGKSGLTFDHILSRLQGELTKSRETGQDLQILSGAMNEIQDTLGGSLPPTLPLYPHVLPPVHPPQPSQPYHPHHSCTRHAPENTANGAVALFDLQSQLMTTQSSLATHVDKIRALEDVFAEQETIKQEGKCACSGILSAFYDRGRRPARTRASRRAGSTSRTTRATRTARTRMRAAS